MSMLSLCVVVLSVVSVSQSVDPTGTECPTTRGVTRCVEVGDLRAEVGTPRGDLVPLNITHFNFDGVSGGYVSVGVNVEGQMPGSSIVSCVRTPSGAVRLQASRATGYSPPEGLLGRDVGLPQAVTATLNGNVFSCQFNWPLRQRSPQFRAFYSTDENRCYLMARGALSAALDITQHSPTGRAVVGCLAAGTATPPPPPPSSVAGPVTTTPPPPSSAANNNRLSIYGALFTTCLIAIAILI